MSNYKDSKFGIENIIAYCNEMCEREKRYGMEDEPNFQFHDAVREYLKELQHYEAVAAEIEERLRNSCKDCAGCTQFVCDCSNIKELAITEFAEKIVEQLKKMYEGFCENEGSVLCCIDYCNEYESCIECLHKRTVAIVKGVQNE